MAVNTDLVQISNLNFCYGSKQALKDISLSVSPGDFVAIIGPNGSGKSTLGKILQGILPVADTAKVALAGYGINTLAARRVMAYAAGNDHMPQFLTGAEYIRYLAKLHSEPKQKIVISDRQIGAAFEKLGMCGMENNLMTSYSHGMLKKTQLIAVLLLGMPISLIDETLNGVDIEAQRIIENNLVELCNVGNAVLMCSHDFAMLERCANRVIFLTDGKIVESAAIAELKTRGIKIEQLVLSYLNIQEIKLVGSE